MSVSSSKSSSSSSSKSQSSSKSSSSKSASSKTKSAAKSAKVKASAVGVNPTLAAAVAAIHIHQFDAVNGVTKCNFAANAYAKQLGYNGFQGLNANQIHSVVSKPGGGWHKATAAESIAAAKAGKLTVASWTGNPHGHVAMVIGQYSPGVPAVAQAGGFTKNGVHYNNTFGYGSIAQTRANPSYYVKD